MYVAVLHLCMYVRTYVCENVMDSSTVDTYVCTTLGTYVGTYMHSIVNMYERTYTCEHS